MKNAFIVINAIEMFGITNSIYTDKAIDSIVLYDIILLTNFSHKKIYHKLDISCQSLNVEIVVVFRNDQMSAFNDEWKLYKNNFDVGIV